MGPAEGRLRAGVCWLHHSSSPSILLVAGAYGPLPKRLSAHEPLPSNHAPACRYLDVNAHAASYTFKALRKQQDGSFEFEPLELQRTLAECGLADERQLFEEHQLPGDFYVPVLHCYWNDDLTKA